MNQSSAQKIRNCTPLPPQKLNYKLFLCSFTPPGVLLSIFLFIFTALYPAAAYALTGMGTEDVPYLISSAEDLETFRDTYINGGDAADACARLTADINLSNIDDWTPIDKYAGTFDGQGYTISGLTISGSKRNVGLFSYIGEGGRIINLKVETTEEGISGSRNVGIIAGRNEGTIDNCVVYGNTKNSGSTGSYYDGYIGGLTGYNSGVVSNCVNYATVTERDANSGRVGGIAGDCASGGTIINCKNYGTISSTTSFIGGIVGMNSGNIANCENLGDVSDTESGGIGLSDIGGIAGTNDGTIENCKNSGQVSGDSGVGGIAGSSYDDISYDCKIKNCENSGTIKGNGGTGGIIGLIESGTVANCVNTGSVPGGGAIVGENCGDQSSVTITNCGWRTDVEGAPENGIGVGDGGTSVTGFDAATVNKIITTLTASINTDEIAVNETATITLTPAPGTSDYAFNTESGAVRITGYESSLPNIASVRDEGMGEFTVTGGAVGRAAITIRAEIHPYIFSSDSYSDSSDDITTCEYVFNVEVTSAPQSENPAPSAPAGGGSGGGGCAAGFGVPALLVFVPFMIKRRK